MSFLQQMQSLQPTSSEVAEIWISTCRLDDDTDVTLGVAWTVLSSAEAARAERFHFARDRERYVRGRAFLRYALGTTVNQDPAKVALTQIANGKPFLDERIHFNLSHSTGLAVLAISTSGPVGIDLEFVDRGIDISGLTRSCFTKGEEQSILDLPYSEQATRFFAFWTAKEARMKLTGDGMSLSPKQIALDIQDGIPVGYLQPAYPAAQAVFINLGYPAALCCLALPLGSLPAMFSCTPDKGRQPISATVCPKVSAGI